MGTIYHRSVQLKVSSLKRSMSANEDCKFNVIDKSQSTDKVLTNVTLKLSKIATVLPMKDCSDLPKASDRLASQKENSGEANQDEVMLHSEENNSVQDRSVLLYGLDRKNSTRDFVELLLETINKSCDHQWPIEVEADKGIAVVTLRNSSGLFGIIIAFVDVFVSNKLKKVAITHQMIL